MIPWAGLFGHLIDDWGSVSNWECDARFSFCLNASAAQISLLPGPFPMQLSATSVHYVRIQFRSGKLPLHCSQVFWVSTFSMAMPTVSFCQHPSDSLLYCPLTTLISEISGCNDAAEVYTLSIKRNGVCSAMVK